MISADHPIFVLTSFGRTSFRASLPAEGPHHDSVDWCGVRSGIRGDEKLRRTSRRSCWHWVTSSQRSIDVVTKSCSVGRTSARNPVRIPRRCPTDGKLLELSDDLVQTPSGRPINSSTPDRDEPIQLESPSLIESEANVMPPS